MTIFYLSVSSFEHLALIMNSSNAAQRDLVSVLIVAQQEEKYVDQVVKEKATYQPVVCISRI